MYYNYFNVVLWFTSQAEICVHPRKPECCAAVGLPHDHGARCGREQLEPRPDGDREPPAPRSPRSDAFLFFSGARVEIILQYSEKLRGILVPSLANVKQTE